MHEISEYTGTDTMLLPDVQMLANNLMLEHGLIEKGWYFTFDRAKKRLGACHYLNGANGPGKITLSSILTPHRSKADIRNTILHEIAHALAGHKAGHGPEWKRVAVSIGCTGDRCSTAPTGAIEYRWYGICNHCGTRTGIHRAPGRVKSCGVCAPGRFSWAHRLRWEENGQEKYLDEMPAKFQAEYAAQTRRYARLDVEMGS